MLTIQECAAQFDLYASLFDKDVAQHEARYQQYKDDSTPDGWAIRTYEMVEIASAKSSAHQLHFCATFLRENTLQWTKDLPDGEGLYWYRHSRFNRPLVVTVWDCRKGLFVSSGAMASYTVEEFAMGGQWAGPLAQPSDQPL